MIKVKVKTIWQGKVGVPHKYVMEAEDLQFLFEDEQMVVKTEDFAKGELGKETFKDKFGGKPYKLVYFKWKPQKLVNTLF